MFKSGARIRNQALFALWEDGEKPHMQVVDLQTTLAQTLAQEVLIVRVLHPRDGMAGPTVKWECYLIDGSDSRSVLLADAREETSQRRGKV